MKKLLYQIVRIINPILSNSTYANLLFWVNCKRSSRPFYKLEIKQPQTFTEKINYIKFNFRSKLAPIVADKYAVRGYVEDKIGEKYLIPLLEVYENPEDIDIMDIEEDCIFKMNNGSGGNYIVKKNEKVSNEDLELFFKKAYNTDMFVYNREWHYKEIKPKIVVEKLLTDNLNDYKFFCTKEGPFAIQVDVDRFSNHTRNLYDLNWNLLPQKINYKNSSRKIDKPHGLGEMIAVAEELCRDFVFSRIDLYNFNNKVWFGEITLHPGGGGEPFDSKQSDLEFGRFLKME